MSIREIKIDEFDYPLPDERIAKHPLTQRDECLLLVKDARGGISTHKFKELPELLPGDSMLIYNNTRVINARLRFRKGDDGTGALIEVFCLEPCEPADYAVSFASTSRCSWTCFVGNSKRWKSGALTMPLTIDGNEFTLSATRVSRSGNTSVVEFSWNAPEVTFSRIISAVGEIPIPPYLNRNTEDSDSADYQTIFSHIEGSVAAPTAGLHFTPEVLSAIDERGIPRREITLHVGAGTFQPVKSDTIGEHEMHSEFIAVPRELIEELSHTDKQVIAVGTTSVRTLESLYHLGCRLHQQLPSDTLPQWYPYLPPTTASELSDRSDLSDLSDLSDKSDLSDPSDSSDLSDPSTSTHPNLSVKASMEAILRHLDATGENTFIASTRLMIAPGYRYRMVKGMVTNFHQPRSTLLLLVSAFLSQPEKTTPTTPTWRDLYTYALSNPAYRFLSYGDACLLL